MKKTAMAAIAVLAVAALTGCSEQDKADTPPEPSWITTVSPTGRKAECLWTGEYGGMSSLSYQADIWCWEVGK